MTIQLVGVKKGDRVNLERALSAASRYGGHSVQGHVDNTVEILSKEIDPPNSLVMRFKVPQTEIDLMQYIVPKGYVCMDGTSLTVVEINWNERWFSVMLIAHTQQCVTLPHKPIGSSVNLEVDQMAKYVESALRGMLNSKQSAIVPLIEDIVRRTR